MEHKIIVAGIGPGNPRYIVEEAKEAIANAKVVERTVDIEHTFGFEYPFMNGVMKVVRDMGATIVSQSYDMDCSMTLSIRSSKMDELKEKIAKVLSPF